MDDAALVQRAANGDKDAFAVIYDRFAGRLYDFLWWVLQDRPEAEGALHDAFMQAGARLPELADPDQLRPWLFAIAGREALHSERRQPHEATAADWNAQRGPDVEQTTGELVELVRATAEELSPTDRAVLDLHLRQGLRGKELADAIGVGTDEADERVREVEERVERSLGADLVARFGRNACPELAALLADWDEKRDPETRERVASHADTCPTCGARRRQRVGTAALLSVAPTFTPPDDVRDRVLDDVHLVDHDGRPPWPPRRGGSGPTDRRWIVMAAIAFVLVVGLGAFLVTRSGKVSQRVAAVGSTTTPLGTRPPTTTATTRTSSTTTSTSSLPGIGAGATLGAGLGSGAFGSGSVAGGSGAATGTGSGATESPSADAGAGSDPSGSGDGGSGGGSPDTTLPDNPVDTSTTTAPTTVPDTQGPALSGLSVSPSVVRARASGCTNSDPTTATVSVRATDPSGVAQVVATVGAPGAPRYTLTSAGGDTYSATIGPFNFLLAAENLPSTVIVQATDGAGNTTGGTAPLTIRCTS